MLVSRNHPEPSKKTPIWAFSLRANKSGKSVAEKVREESENGGISFEKEKIS
jgi:hypothetical protein